MKRSLQKIFCVLFFLIGFGQSCFLLKANANQDLIERCIIIALEEGDSGRCPLNHVEVNGLCCDSFDNCCNPCSIGSELVGGQCVLMCPDGQERVEGQCVPKCTDPKVRNDQTGACVCPVEFDTTVDGQCVPKCPAGQERVGNECLDPCQAGQERVRNECLDPCPAPKDRNDQTGACECPFGQILCADNSCKASIDLCENNDPPYGYNCPKELIDALNALLVYLNALEPIEYANTQISFDLALNNVIEAIIDCDAIPAESKKSHSNKQSCNKNLLAQLLLRIERSKELDPNIFGEGFLDLEALRDNLNLVNIRCNKKKKPKQKKAQGHNGKKYGGN